MSDPPERGDPRVLVLLNAVLSAAFAALVLVAGEFVGFVGFAWPRFLALTALLMAATHLVTRP